MKTDVLCSADGLSDEQPRLWQAVHGAEERRHQKEALNVFELYGWVACVVQDERTTC